MPDGIDGDSPASDAIKNHVGSASNNQFSDSRFASGTTQMAMMFKGINQRNDADHQPLGSIRLVSRNVSTNLAQFRASQWRPDNL